MMASIKNVVPQNLLSIKILSATLPAFANAALRHHATATRTERPPPLAGNGTRSPEAGAGASAREGIQRKALDISNSSLNATFAPMLVSEDQVDRVPWIAMIHPSFRHVHEKFEGDLRSLVKTAPHMHLVFYCDLCGLKNLKKVSKKAFYDGVVLIRCDDCRKWHLLSDRLNWFAEDHGELGEDLETLFRRKLSQAALVDDTVQLEGLKKSFPLDII